MTVLQSPNNVRDDTTVNEIVRSTKTNSPQTCVHENTKHERQNDTQNDGDAEESQQTDDSDVDTKNTTRQHHQDTDDVAKVLTYTESLRKGAGRNMMK